jgi:hypothetical protein
MNSDYFVALAKTFEDHYGVEFQEFTIAPVPTPASA